MWLTLSNAFYTEAIYWLTLSNALYTEVIHWLTLSNALIQRLFTAGSAGMVHCWCILGIFLAYCKHTSGTEPLRQVSICKDMDIRRDAACAKASSKSYVCVCAHDWYITAY